MTAADISQQPLLTADGTPLKVSLQRSMRRNKLRAIALVVPPFLFLVLLFVIPIGELLVRSADDRLINTVLPRTFAIYDDWDRQTVPGEAMFEAMFLDITTASKLSLGRSSTRMNYEKSGWRSLIKKSSRKFKKIKGPPYKEAMIKAEKRWGEVKFWQALGAMKDPYTLGYYLNAIDMRFDADKNPIMQPENRQVYVTLWWRTFLVSLMVTVFCLILAYPVAHLLATLPLRYSNLLMICVLMPFWTSLLVRIVAWMVMLQQQGVVNDTLVWAGILADETQRRGGVSERLESGHGAGAGHHPGRPSTADGHLRAARGGHP